MHTYAANAWEQPVAAYGVDVRAQFIARTYLHLLGAILAFTGIEVVLFQTGLAYPMARAMLSVSWLLILGGFMVVSWLASRVAMEARSLSSQYLALGAFIVAEALLFVPMLVLADLYAPGAIKSAVVVTLVGFGGLTGVALWSRKDFSFLGAMLKYGAFLALAIIAGGVLFGFHLGVWFSVAMVGFAGAAILYDTSNVLHHYPQDRHVAAALQLFASFALMLWYVLRLFMSRR